MFYVQTDRQSESSFDTSTIGGDMRASYRLPSILTQGWRYTLKQTDVRMSPTMLRSTSKKPRARRVIPRFRTP